MALKQYAALDLGAGSGRVILGSFDGSTIKLEEAHRFSNEPVEMPDGLYWNVLKLFTELKQGLRKAAEMAEGEISGIGVDTWGVDYGLLDEAGRLVSNPHNYRDPRTDGMLEEAFKRMPREKLFGSTGIQFMQINTVFQLLSQVQNQDPALSMAHRLLMMPDLFNYWFTGKQTAERTIASTSQCYNPNTGTWATDVLEALNIPAHLFADIIDPGTVIGPIRAGMNEVAGLENTPVIAVGSHDTASAVAAVPLTGPGEAYLSCGTWSLLGIESPKPVVNETTLRHNFTNEAGVEGTTRLLKNITGLWIIQEMRRVWGTTGETLSYEDMADQANAAPAFKHFIDNDDALFLQPGDMPSRIAEYCKKTQQPVPEARNAFIRTAYESLAFKYRRVVDLLEELIGQPIHTIHIVGGGSQNIFLNQCAASATGRTVKIGPTEATATGNILMQMVATGQIGSIAEGRKLIPASFPSKTYEPQDTEAWNAAYKKFCEIVKA